MVKFKLITIIDGFYHYEIYPEGDTSNVGVLVFNPQTKELKERTNPSYPYDSEKWIGHAISGLRDESGEYKHDGMVAWG